MNGVQWLVSVEVQVEVDPDVTDYRAARSNAEGHVRRQMEKTKDDLKLRWEIVDAEPKEEDPYE